MVESDKNWVADRNIDEFIDHFCESAEWDVCHMRRCKTWNKPADSKWEAV